MFVVVFSKVWILESSVFFDSTCFAPNMDGTLLMPASPRTVCFSQVLLVRPIDDIKKTH